MLEKSHQYSFLVLVYSLRSLKVPSSIRLKPQTKNTNKGLKVHLKMELRMTTFLSLLRDGQHNRHL